MVESGCTWESPATGDRRLKALHRRPACRQRLVTKNPEQGWGHVLSYLPKNPPRAQLHLRREALARMRAYCGGMNVSILRFTQGTAPNLPDGSPVMYRSPDRDRVTLKAVSHVCQTWLQHVPETDPRRVGVMSALLSAESATVDEMDREKTGRALVAFCNSCKAIHPDLAIACNVREKADAGLTGCWLIGLLAGA
jgi:hypothetical protein